MSNPCLRASKMKKLKFTIAALLTLCMMQGALAVAPGGALGSGSKKGRVEKESAPRMEATGPESPIMDPSMEAMETQVVTNTQEETPSIETTSKVNIGKKAQEGQSSNSFDAEDFDRLALNQMNKKEARKELKERIKQLRQKVKNNEPASSMADDMLILCVILCFFIPPLAVYLATGEIGFEFWLSLILTLLFFVPGVIYSLIVVLS